MLKKNFLDNYTKAQFYISTLIIFLISKSIIFYIGIKPNMGFAYWQILDISLLHNDLMQSLLYLHSEPILWNLLLGLSLKLFNGNITNITSFIYIFHISLSYLIVHYTYKILIELKFSKRIIFIVILFLIFSPNIIYYENWIFYSHLTCFLFFQLFYFIIKIFKDYSLKIELLIYCNLLVLTLTWKLFHPIIIILFFLFFLFFIKNFLKSKSIIFFLIFFTLSMLQTVKNKIVFGFFSSGSLIGLNLAQTVSFANIGDGKGFYEINFPEGILKSNYMSCDFSISKENEENYFILFDKKRENFSHESLVGEKSRKNNVGGIFKSKKCLKIATEHILNNPVIWMKSRFMNILRSHSKFAIDHGYKPLGWDNYFGFVKTFKANNFTRVIQVIVLLTYMLSIYLFYLKKIFFSKEELFVKKSFFCIFTFYGYIVFIGHFLNGWEQERFLYTGFALQIIFIAYLFKKLIRIKS